jgi:hypothetical protein
MRSGGHWELLRTRTAETYIKEMMMYWAGAWFGLVVGFCGGVLADALLLHVH